MTNNTGRKIQAWYPKCTYFVNPEIKVTELLHTEIYRGVASGTQKSKFIYEDREKDPLGEVG